MKYLNIKKNFFGRNDLYAAEYDGEKYITDKYAIINTKYIKPEILKEWHYKYGVLPNIEVNDFIKHRFKEKNTVSPEILLVYKNCIYQNKEYKIDVFKHCDEYFYMQHKYSIFPSNQYKLTGLYYLRNFDMFTLSPTKLIYAVMLIKTDISQETINNLPVIQQELIKPKPGRWDDILE